MRTLILLFLLTVVTACAPQTRGAYEQNPAKRHVRSDEFDLYVVPLGGHEYVAWGGEKKGDPQVQYRQKRAIEIVSGCRVREVESVKGEDVLRARVKC